MDIFVPETTKNGAAILFIHGGGWHAGKRQDWHRVMEVYTEHGYVCATASYRLVPQACFPASLEDAKEAMTFLKGQASRLGFDPDRIATYGSSAGGHLALMLAVDDDVAVRPACTVALCPVTCLADAELRGQKFVREFVGSSYEEDPDAFRAATPEYALTDGLPPMLFVHGDKDSTIPYKLSDRFCRKYLAAGNLAELHKLPDTEHGFGYAAQTPAQLQTIEWALEFLNRQLLAEETNLMLGREYRVSFPGLEQRTGDLDNKALTDGQIPSVIGTEGWLTVDLAQREFEVKNFNGEFIKAPAWDEQRLPRFSVMGDFGFLSTVSRVEAVFGRDTKNGVALPTRTEVYLSDDGYNFTYYPAQTEQREEDGDVCRYVVSFASKKRAKAVRFVAYSEEGVKLSIGEFEIYGVLGTPTIPLSVKQGDITAETVLAVDTVDPRNAQKCAVVNIELDGEQPLAELIVEAVGGTVEEPRYIASFYSQDGETYEDFGTSHLRHAYGTAEEYTAIYNVTRNHTVNARYVRVYVYGNTETVTVRRIAIRGAEQAVAEPLYGHMGAREITPHTNVLEDKPLLVNGVPTDTLTDRDYMHKTVTVDAGTTVIEREFDEPLTMLNSIAVNLHLSDTCGLPRSVVTELRQGDRWIEVCSEFIHHETNGRAIVRQLFGDHRAEGVRITVTADTPLCLSQAAAYNGRPQLPVIDGGFINPNFQNVANNEGIAHHDNFMWYIVLKGMKDLGMDVVVIHYTTNKRNMFTLLRNAPQLEALGYKELHIYNSGDPLESILSAADKLDMKLFVGTCVGLGFNRVPYESYHDEIIEAALITMDQLAEQYGHHRSFYGYYFSDETSDGWLAWDGAVEKFRHVYESQSKHMREHYPDKRCMICPATWRETPPEVSAKNLYELLKSDEEGGRPVVDIVAQQDCLGRLTDLILPEYVYGEFETHVQEWARAIRKAGAEFWNDLEVFNFNIISKHIEDTLHGLEIESRFTGGNIVFDIVNYFSPLSRTGRLDAIHRGVYSWQCAREDDYFLRYVQYYRTLYADATRCGTAGIEKRSGV